MKALSLKQPWAELIANGTKLIETRTWTTMHRGTLLIVASRAKSADREAMVRFRAHGPFPRSVAVCVVELLNCRPMTPEDEKEACCPCEPGRYAWILGDVCRVQPVFIRGQLSLYDVPDEKVVPL